MKRLVGLLMVSVVCLVAMTAFAQTEDDGYLVGWDYFVGEWRVQLDDVFTYRVIIRSDLRLDWDRLDSDVILDLTTSTLCAFPGISNVAQFAIGSFDSTTYFPYRGYLQLEKIPADSAGNDQLQFRVFRYSYVGGYNPPFPYNDKQNTVLEYTLKRVPEPDPAE